MNRVGILYRPHVKRAQELAEKLEARLTSHGTTTWLGSAWDDDAARDAMAGTDLVVGIGGDGSLLHCARVTAPFGTPVLGVKLGKLGFITEVGEEGALDALQHVLDGRGWIEERTMLRACVGNDTYVGLNDAVLRCTAVRLIAVECEVDEEPLTTVAYPNSPKKSGLLPHLSTNSSKRVCVTLEETSKVGQELLAAVSN